jgi:hypothetical protein
MNRQISRVALLSLLLLSALIVATTYWQVWAAPGLAARQDNAIERVAQFRIRRGLIYASDGKTVLAANRAVKAGGQTLYSRRTASRPRRSATRPRAGRAQGSSGRRTRT